MWFDTRAKMAEIEGRTPATIATPATMRADPAPRVAEVASVATPARLKPEQARPDTADFPYGFACNLGDAPRTWTGRIVSLDEWRRLTEWEKHGPNGRVWCGLCQGWHWPGDCEDGGAG